MQQRGLLPCRSYHGGCTLLRHMKRGSRCTSRQQWPRLASRTVKAALQQQRWEEVLPGRELSS